MFRAKRLTKLPEDAIHHCGKHILDRHGLFESTKGDFMSKKFQILIIIMNVLFALSFCSKQSKISNPIQKEIMANLNETQKEVCSHQKLLR